MTLKRRRSDEDEGEPRSDDDTVGAGALPLSFPRQRPSPHRARLGYGAPASSRAVASLPVVPRTGPDLLSPLSDELLVRILSFLRLDHLLAVSPVSHRFHRIAADSQLWKALYYDRFVLPRAMRIPGFREGGGAGNRLHYAGRRALWADGRHGGLVRELAEAGIQPHSGEEDLRKEDLNWKRQYRIRHNWARGKCTVEELRIGSGEASEQDTKRMLVKVVEGIAVTADKGAGLRAWNLKTREMLAQASLEGDDTGSDEAPSCIAIDDRELHRKILEVSLGFGDGSFGIWRLDIAKKTLERRYRHEKSSNGKLIAMAFSYPYLLTATEAVVASLYTFDIPDRPESSESYRTESTSQTGRDTQDRVAGASDRKKKTPAAATTGNAGQAALPAPYLLTSLTSLNARSPIALSIRRSVSTIIASIAFTFNLRRGWSIGIQDIHVTLENAALGSAPEVTSSLITYTDPLRTGRPSSYFNDVAPRQSGILDSLFNPPPPSPAREAPTTLLDEPGPTNLCYTHPYLLATLPDNTLVLWLCKSTASSLTLSPGIRLWGHTSGISGADITARGKAVSVSKRGEEMRVWELEGRSTNRFGGLSVEIRPDQTAGKDIAWDERRNWVGFDDEMVIVLKEKGGGRESLMVYDFT
ncbi:hypothetical protein GQ53DRAFT_798419 [Thozetella sp. PMI_491]|nr:hypothetical protein GQ53DRAFT_798419 [Thozetella sp. PMI_491]